jgi:methylamine dehydrogenase accessory protein MauD
MVDALIVSNMLLWVAVIALAGLVLALLRQIGVLHERVAPAGALVGREGPRVGESAAPLDLLDWSGTPLTVGGARDRDTLLFFVSPTCPVCEELLPTVPSTCRSEGAELVIVSDGGRAEHADFVAAHGLAGARYVLSGELGMTYQIGRVPYAVLLDAEGVVRARGLVNTREHVESLFEARARGVGTVQEWARRRQDSRRVA